MTSVIKSKNVCYICQLFHGGNRGGTRIDNTPKRYKYKEKMFKKGEKQRKNLFLDDGKQFLSE